MEIVVYPPKTQLRRERCGVEALGTEAQDATLFVIAVGESLSSFSHLSHALSHLQQTCAAGIRQDR